MTLACMPTYPAIRGVTQRTSLPLSFAAGCRNWSTAPACLKTSRRRCRGVAVRLGERRAARQRPLRPSGPCGPDALPPLRRAAAGPAGRPAIGAPVVNLTSYGADSDTAARVIRTAIPGKPAEAAPGRNEAGQDTDQPQVRHSLPSRVHRSRDRRVNHVTIQRKGHA